MQLKLTSDQATPPDQRDVGAPRIDLHKVTAADEAELVRLAQTFHQEDGHPLTGRGEQALRLVARGHPQARAWLIGMRTYCDIRLKWPSAAEGLPLKRSASQPASHSASAKAVPGGWWVTLANR